MADRDAIERDIRAYFDGPAGYGLPPQARARIVADITEIVTTSLATPGARDVRAPVATRMRRQVADKALR